MKIKPEIIIKRLGVNEWNPYSKKWKLNRMVDRFLLAIKRKNKKALRL